MRSMLSALLLAAVVLTSCKESGKESAESPAAESAVAAAPAPRPDPQSILGKEGTVELMNMLQAYYSLKDALVATNGARADEAASKLMSAAELMHSGMQTIPQKAELQAQLQVVMDNTEAIMATKAEAIEEKRSQFSGVSDAVYRISKISNLEHAGVYRQYCPMAFNDKGAYWLSAESDIKNPYFGNKMLGCGEVRDSL